MEKRRLSKLINNEMGNKDFLVKRSLALKAITLLVILGYCLNTFCCPVKTSSSMNQRSNQLGTNAEIIEELFVDDERIQITTGFYYRNSVVRINLTVLPKSNASVELFTSEELASRYSPALQNVTLAPGESFSKEHTFVYGELTEIVYACQCTTDSNATILWIYEVLHSARPIGLDFPFIVSSLLLSSLVIAVVSKRKQKGKK